MQKNYIFSLVTACLLMGNMFTAYPQEKGYSFDLKINWENVNDLYPGHALLSFEGAVNHDSLGFLPVYRHEIADQHTGKISDAFLTEEIYALLEIDDPLNYPDLEKIADQPVILVSKYYSRKVEKQALYLMPVRKAAGSNGFEKLVSCKVNFDLSQAEQPETRSEALVRNYADHSVLKSGDWYKLAVRQTGIHRISYADLVAMGIDPQQTDPRKLRLYGNGNGMLEEANSIDRIDDLMENSIYVEGEEDGQFDEQDYILFYGEGPVEHNYVPFYDKWVHENNFYTKETYYFLTIGDEYGKRIVQGELLTDEPTHEVYQFQDLTYHEKEEINLLKSGKLWYGEVFNSQTDYVFPFDMPDRVLEEPMYLRADLAGRSTTATEFSISVDGSRIAELSVPSIVLGSQIYARPITTNYLEFYSDANPVEMAVSFEKPGAIDVGWLNYLQINYTRHLRFVAGQLGFRNARVLGSENIARYHIQTGQDITVWDVSDPSAISRQVLQNEANGVSLKSVASYLKEFIAFDGKEYFTVEYAGKVENQDLHSIQDIDYLIVAHPMFLEEAERLADHHRQFNGMVTHIVTPQQIYNEFSSGAQDISAIRDFVKMLYDRAEPGNELRYLLLFGDASYDYMGYLPEDNNLVPTYQSKESLKSAASFVTDDFFGCLDIDEGSNGSGTMDVGVGRFPVHTLEQARAMVDKSLNYMVPARENMGAWRNAVCFIGDDEDNNTHLGQAEGLVEIADSLGKAFNYNKIYLDAYQQLSTPSGPRYPNVNEAIDKVVNDGCLIVNYTGHGGEVAWAEERILDIPAIQSYRNITHLPVFLTATCEFSRYDDPGLVSAGELVFLNPDGAGVALFTTTRLAFSQSNYALNKRFYYEAFNRDTITGEYPRLGDLIRASKTPSNQNIKNFVLLGDPALMLAYPRMHVRTLNITNEQLDKRADTISALSRVTIEGQVEDLQGNLMEGFNGLVYPSVFDKPVRYQTRGNDPTSKVTDFYIQDKKIFEGVATVKDGKFTFSFIVPVDISYQYGKGKISYYAADTINLIDAQGYEEIYIGGSDDLGVTDEAGPEIGLYLNAYSFVSGDYTTPNPLLIATLADSSGINTVGNGIGHDIVAIIDGNYQEPLILNDYFIPETDSYQQGKVICQLGPFTKGNHTLTLKAWDILNNSSEKTITFIVNSDARLTISQAGNYPNPFESGTNFTFKHNKPGIPLEVRIHIYNLSGQPVNALDFTVLTESTESGPLFWDGKDNYGNELPAGLYVYKIWVESEDGFISSVSQKFVIFKK
jgi:hypothetical protein